MDWFPVTLATGRAFCNRVKERRILKQYIKLGRHAVLMAARRYGKTSLIYQVLLEMNLPHTIMELTLATNAVDVQRLLVSHISGLLYSILPKSEKAKQNILSLFSWLRPELVLTVGEQKLIFHPELSKENPIDNVSKLLRKLNDAAKVVNKRVVVVMDEFQQLSDIEEHAMEASIRHAMQYSTHVSYIFSGSNRRMLQSMFNDKNRPFYNSCEILQIDRISKQNYCEFINIAAQSQWKKNIPDEVLDEIFEITQLHPNYINRVCGHFWVLNEIPTIKRLHEYWSEFLDSKRAEFTKDVLQLAKNQRKMLAYLSRNPTKHPSTHEICTAVGLSEASVRQAVKSLLANDYLYKDKEELIQILDPALKDFIKNLS